MTMRRKNPEGKKAGSGTLPDRRSSARPDPALSSKEARRWLDQNRPAIAAYNAYVERYGCFADRLRAF